MGPCGQGGDGRRCRREGVSRGPNPAESRGFHSALRPEQAQGQEARALPQPERIQRTAAASCGSRPTSPGTSSGGCTDGSHDTSTSGVTPRPRISRPSRWRSRATLISSTEPSSSGPGACGETSPRERRLRARWCRHLRREASVPGRSGKAVNTTKCPGRSAFVAPDGPFVVPRRGQLWSSLTGGRACRCR